MFAVGVAADPSAVAVGAVRAPIDSDAFAEWNRFTGSVGNSDPGAVYAWAVEMSAASTVVFRVAMSAFGNVNSNASTMQPRKVIGSTVPPSSTTPFWIVSDDGVSP